MTEPHDADSDSDAAADADDEFDDDLLGLLDDRVIIVTGVGPGLGRSVAVQCARQGAYVVAVARSDDNLEATLDAIEDAVGPDAAIGVQADIAADGAGGLIVSAALEEFGRVDGLVNNAFRGPGFRRFADADLAAWREVFDVNVFGTLAVTQSVVRQMSAQQPSGGSVVFIGTMAASLGQPRQAEYAASKGAMQSCARALASELGPVGIRVNTVAPGWMWGPGVQAFCDHTAQRRGVEPDVVRAEIAANIPLGDIPTDDACAGAVVYALSPLAAAMTGQTIHVNGGEFYA